MVNAFISNKRYIVTSATYEQFDIELYFLITDWR